MTYYKTNKNREMRIKHKNFLFDVLGKVCKNCKESDYEVLQIDHINNDGYELGNDGERYTQRKIRNYDGFLKLYKQDNLDFIKKHQLLCANCNMKKENYRREFKRLEKWNIPPF